MTPKTLLAAADSASARAALTPIRGCSAIRPTRKAKSRSAISATSGSPTKTARASRASPTTRRARSSRASRPTARKSHSRQTGKGTTTSSSSPPPAASRASSPSIAPTTTSVGWTPDGKKIVFTSGARERARFRASPRFSRSRPDGGLEQPIDTDWGFSASYSRPTAQTSRSCATLRSGRANIIAAPMQPTSGQWTSPRAASRNSATPTTKATTSGPCTAATAKSTSSPTASRAKRTSNTAARRS